MWECIHSSPLPLTAADPFPDAGASSSHDEGGLGNGISEAALPPGPDANTTRRALPRDHSLFQVRKIHQHPVAATLDVDSSAEDTKETKGQQEPTAMENPKAHSGNEELEIPCPTAQGRFMALPGMWWHRDIPRSISCSWAVTETNG